VRQEWIGESILMRIETERLIIRNFEVKDKDDLGEYMLQRVNKEFEGYPDFSADKIENEIKYRSGSHEFFAIELKEEHKVIGNIYLGIRDFNSKELGYVLNENYHLKGYGSEAAKAVVQWAFSQGVHRVFAECTPLNISSWKTMERIGLKREAELRQNVSFHTDEAGNPIYWDTYVYGALSTDNI
jgi:ribosomal-protein-alanine N-acetyltransferase